MDSTLHLSRLPLFVLVLSSGCGGEANLGSKDVDSGPLDATSEGNPKGDASSESSTTVDAAGRQCTSISDCPQSSDYFDSYSCLGPYEIGGCACNPVVICTMDSECDGGSVCREDPAIATQCLIGPDGTVDGGLVCTAPCTTDSTTA